MDAINDKNVLPFRVDYIKTMDKDDEMADEEVWSISKESAYMAPARISLVTKYILDHFDQKTYRGQRTYNYNVLQNISDVASGAGSAIAEIKKKKRVSGFNSIFAVSSVPMAKLYYQEFQKQMAADPTKRLKVATIFSYGANEEEELQKIISEEKLRPEETHRFIEEAFQTGEVKTSGTDISAILPPMSPFDKRRAEKKQTVIEKIKAFFERFFGV